MRLLLDTHVVYWLTMDPAKLRIGERELIARAEGALAFSAVSIWELRLKWDSFHGSGQRKGPASPASILAALRGVDCEELMLAAHDAATPMEVPLGHKDPFDELLMVQAQVGGMRLLTRDKKLDGHPLAVTG